MVGTAGVTFSKVSILAMDRRVLLKRRARLPVGARQVGYRRSRRKAGKGGAVQEVREAWGEVR